MMSFCSPENVGHIIRHALSLLYKGNFEENHLKEEAVNFIFRKISSEGAENTLASLIHGIITCPEIICVNYPNATKKEVAISLSTYFFSVSSLKNINAVKIKEFTTRLLELQNKSTVEDVDILIYYILNYH